MIKNVFITGKPGCGKTTLVKNIVSDVSDLSLDACGFYTLEIRCGGERVGFEIISLDGRKGILAHADFKVKPSVGKYGVNIKTLEEIGVYSIESSLKENKKNNKNKLIVIDEVGRMELFSDKFRIAVLDALNSGNFVLGTIKSASCEFTDEIRKRDDVKIFELTRENEKNNRTEIIKIINSFYS